MTDKNQHISKSSFKAVEKFNAELESFAKGSDQDINAVELYEDANTMFTLSPLKIEDGYLTFLYDGDEDRIYEVFFDEEFGKYYEDEGVDGIKEYVRFFKKCLKRAVKYWEMDSEELDKIQDGEIEEEQ